MVFPELLASIFAGNSLEDCRQTLAIVISRGLGSSPTFLSARVFLLELGQVVNVVIDNDPEIVGLVVRRNVVGGE